MKRKFFCVLLTAALAFALVGCGKGYDYTAHISELRSDLFKAETDEFSITLACVSREYPYAADGIACPRTDVVEVSLVPAVRQETYEVYFATETGEQGGEAAFRNAYGDYFFSESVTAFPEGSVSIRVVWGEESREVTATSVKNERTLSPFDALQKAIEAEKERVERMTDDVFLGEFHVRLLRRDKNYYYVGIVDRDGETLSMLLDSETGEVLATRDTRV